MPMIRHDAVRKKCDVLSIDGSAQHVLERVVIPDVVKQTRLFRSSVDDVKYEAGSGHTRAPWHDGVINASAVPRQASGQEIQF